MKSTLLAVALAVVPLSATRAASAEQTVKTAANETRATVASTQQKAAAIRNQATAPVKAARDQAVAKVASARNQATTQLTGVRDSATSQVNAARAQVKDKLKSPFTLPKFDVPDLALAAKTRSASVDPKVTSPRTLTYKSRVSRISRWISPLTLGLIAYVPFDTMNAGVVAQINNLMAEERIAVESMTADAFEEYLKEGKRWKQCDDSVFKIQINRYALEQYAANPDALREDFATAVQTATKRAAAQANAVPKASVKVLPAGASVPRRDWRSSSFLL